MRRLRSDEGISIIMVAMALLLLMGAAAVAVDLAAMRLDRSADQKVTDSAASAGALAAFQGNGQDACEAALAYVAVNAQGINSLDTSGCFTSFSSGACDGATIPQSYTPPAVDRFSVTITYPVPDGDPLMTSGLLGGTGQPLVAEDGEQCERVAVEMSATHTSLFAQLLGFDQGTTTVHSVARSFDPGEDGPPLNLLVLDRSGCEAIHVRGQGGVIVETVIDDSTTPPTEYPGVAAADSDASSGCTPSVLLAEGQGVLRADGKPGCATEVTAGTGDGCGIVQSLAPGTPGCMAPACQVNGSNASVTPDPISMGQRITRAQVDYEYNCWADYTAPPAGTSWAVSPLSVGSGQDIPGCTTGDPDYIYDLIAAVGSSSNPVGLGSWSSWTGSGHSCLIDTSDPDMSLSGNWVIDCPVFTVRRHIQISGNVVFDGDVNVTGSSGHLDIIGAPGWAVFRDGTLTKDGQASLTFDQTMVYMSDTSQVAMSGGSGTLTWIAPDSGDFDDLALWGDSASTHFWAGQANLAMRGVFFTPWARADYSGTSGQNQTSAQWVAHSLEAHGQGVLTITPEFEFPVKVDGTPRTTIIR